MIRDGKHRLLRESQALGLHARRHHGVGLPGSDDVGQEGVRRLENAPHGRFLMRSKGNVGTGSRQGQVVTGECPNPDIVEVVVVLTHEAFAAGVVLPNPLGEPFLDLLLLFPRRLGRRGVDNPLIRIPWIRNRRLWECED